MPSTFRIAYFAHSVRSDWNNGNAHFLRGLLRAMGRLGHDVEIFEPEQGWSITHLQTEERGPAALQDFGSSYRDLRVTPYPATAADSEQRWEAALRDRHIVIVHEWNEPALVKRLLSLREKCGYRILFHDTHHRATSAAQQIAALGIQEFDGVLAFGEALSRIYREQFDISSVWTLHEAADTSVFYPKADAGKASDVVWIGNWGDGERSKEIHEFLLRPARLLPHLRYRVYGVRYPREGIEALQHARIPYCGYLPNLDAVKAYAVARVTLHIPRQQYVSAMRGIPTIRVFEALACGIPLVSAPWRDVEQLFRKGDFRMVQEGAGMAEAISFLVKNPDAAADQAARGLETVLARHTCMHRAAQLTSICEEVVA